MVPLDRLSRFLSFLLRHRPAEYPLAFDRQGFVGGDELLRRVQARFPDATEDDIREIVTATDKQRFELRGDKVRATYGRSEEHTSELQSRGLISYAVFCLKK